MQIWHFCATAVDLTGEQGGVSNVVGSLATESAEAGIETVIVCGDHELGSKVQQTGVARPVPRLSVHSLSDRPLSPLRTMRQLRKLIFTMPPDAISHVHACFSVFADGAMYYLRRRGLPYIVSPHGKLSPGMLAKRSLLKNVWWNSISRENFNCARKVGLFSEGESKLFQRLGVSISSITIPNGFKIPAVEAAKESKFTPSDPYILFLGYLDPRKQPDLLIRAFAQSRARDYCKLLLVGPDPYGFGPKLQTEVFSAGLAGRVIFYGPAYGSEKWDILNAAELLCLPSLGEGMPLVLVEAAAVGTPSMFSKESNGGTFADAGAGVEVSSHDAMEWAREIDRIMEAPQHRRAMSNAALKLSTSYHWPAISRRWIDVYRGLMGAGPS